MGLFSTIGSKGQVTVPLEIRRRLGLKEGDRVEFFVDNGQTFIRPARLEANPFKKYIGSLPAFQTRQQVNEWVAELREDDRD